MSERALKDILAESARLRRESAAINKRASELTAKVQAITQAALEAIARAESAGKKTAKKGK
jgi:hypothetical protein